MKTITCLGLFFVCTLLSNCTKSTTTDKTVNSVSTPVIGITGTWQWMESLTGWQTTLSPSADSLVKLRIYSDSSYILLVNNQQRNAGKLHTFTTPAPGSQLVIQFDKNLKADKMTLFANEGIMFLQGDSLRLYDFTIVDGSSHLFRATNN